MGGADAGLGDIRQTVGFASVAPGSPVDVVVVVVVVVFSVGLAWTSSHLHTDVAYRRVSDVVAWRLGDAVLFRAMVPSFSTGFFVVVVVFFLALLGVAAFKASDESFSFFVFLFFCFFFGLTLSSSSFPSLFFLKARRRCSDWPETVFFFSFFWRLFAL